MRTCSFRLACFFMQSSAREALQVVAERFLAERCLENCDLKNFVGVIKMLYEVTRSAKWNDLLRQAIWESTVREVLQIISQTCLYERWLVDSDLKKTFKRTKISIRTLVPDTSSWCGKPFDKKLVNKLKRMDPSVCEDDRHTGLQLRLRGALLFRCQIGNFQNILMTFDMLPTRKDCG